MIVIYCTTYLACSHSICICKFHVIEFTIRPHSPNSSHSSLATDSSWNFLRLGSLQVTTLLALPIGTHDEGMCIFQVSRQRPRNSYAVPGYPSDVMLWCSFKLYRFTLSTYSINILRPGTVPKIQSKYVPSNNQLWLWHRARVHHWPHPREGLSGFLELRKLTHHKWEPSPCNPTISLLPRYFLSRAPQMSR